MTMIKIKVMSKPKRLEESKYFQSIIIVRISMKTPAKVNNENDTAKEHIFLAADNALSDKT